jgi:NADH dehydrogenase
MMGAVLTRTQQLVTVFGGSGFLGRYVVRALAQRGYRVRVAVRRPDLAGHLQPLGKVGQIHAVQANLRHRGSIEHAVDRADAVVNLVGILRESGRQTFAAVQADGAAGVAEAARAVGASLVHVSALGADANATSLYARSKAEGEAAALAAGAAVFRPSLMFGPGDSSFNRFGSLARTMPVLPLVGADTRFQPVYAADVGEAVARAVDGDVARGRIYELGGPEIRTLYELVAYVLQQTERRRPVLKLSPGLGRLQAIVMETLDLLTLGLLPNELKLTRDQVVLLQHDNVVSPEANAEGRTLQGIGIEPTAFEAIVPAYLVRFRTAGQFDGGRVAFPSASPDTIAPDESGARGAHLRPGEPAGPAVDQRAAG